MILVHNFIGLDISRFTIVYYPYVHGIETINSWLSHHYF